jgi:hypothetical protein
MFLEQGGGSGFQQRKAGGENDAGSAQVRFKLILIYI